MPHAIGLTELSSIARGFEVADAMLKAAHVELLLNRSICPGKYMVLVGGEVAAVESSVEAGLATGAESIVDSFVIPNIHPSIFGAFTGSNEVSEVDALGVIETFSVAALIEAADAAAKAAKVEIMEIRLAMAIGGKAYVTLTGEVAAVEAAVAAGAHVAGEKGLLVARVVIPSPRKEITQETI